MQLLSGSDWQTTLSDATGVAPEAFDGEVLRNLIQGQWQAQGQPSPLSTPIDGTVIAKLSRLDAESAQAAVTFAASDR